MLEYRGSVFLLILAEIKQLLTNNRSSYKKMKKGIAYCQEKVLLEIRNTKARNGKNRNGAHTVNELKSRNNEEVPSSVEPSCKEACNKGQDKSHKRKLRVEEMQNKKPDTDLRFKLIPNRNLKSIPHYLLVLP
ncbi:hypothetical protein FQA39_LY08638 [Lamprigera yunnana]|nr:hypothetical protein FQA39_LY08638 [Lamprigera yunnana]